MHAMENDNENVKWVTEWERKRENESEDKKKWMRNGKSIFCMQYEMCLLNRGKKSVHITDKTQMT